jgi:Na+-translocating ferredoxin:NAD+ oxidoreductase subunit A
MGLNLFLLAVSSILVNNFVFSRTLGTCPYVGVSNNTESSIGMGWAVMFVMSVASVVCWFIQDQILKPLQLEYLQTITFILVIASLVQFLELFIRKYSPALEKMLGIYLPLITTNCAVLGVTLININSHYNMLESLVNGLSGGIGFTLALILMSSIRERLETSPMPTALKGVPITFISASLISMSFLGFQGLIRF